MTVTEKLMGVGAWSLRLRADTPRQILNRLLPAQAAYGHVIVTPNWADLGSLDDAEALALSRYTGIYLKRDESGLVLSGYGVNGWLGDGQRGRSIGSLTTAGGTFAEWAAAVLPTFLPGGAGIVSSIPGTYATVFTRTYFREIADAVAARFGANWRINPDFSFDFGTPADLFRVTPQALVVRHRADSGRDLAIRGLNGELEMTRDVEDWVRRVVYFYDDPTPVLQAGGVAEADVPFRGPDGSPAFVDRIVEDSQTTVLGDATAFSLTEWQSTTGVRNELTLTSTEYDIGRDVAVGDNVYVFDADRGIFDLGNPVTYRGQTIFPQVIRCVGYTWPIRQGMGVWLRRYVKPSSSWVVEWTDLTPYVVWETSDTTVEVGAKPRTTL